MPDKLAKEFWIEDRNQGDGNGDFWLCSDTRPKGFLGFPTKDEALGYAEWLLTFIHDGAKLVEEPSKP